MSAMREDDFDRASSEIELSHRIERLQEIACYLLSRNEELRVRIGELERAQPQD